MMGTKRRKTRLDLHLHTPTSDGYGTPAEYVRAIQKADLDGVVITDHHVTRGLGGGDKKVGRPKPASDEIARAIRDAGLICLRGCEYSTNEGHLLVYGVDVADLDLGMYPPMQEVVWKVLEAGGAAVPSHPYYGYRKRCGDHLYQLEGLAAVEGWNAQNQVRGPAGESLDVQAQRAAAEIGLPVVGTSDAHVAYRIGTCYTEFDGSVRRSRDLVEALLDPAARFRPVVNRRKVAAQKRVGYYSSAGLVDRGGKTPYREETYESPDWWQAGYWVEEGAQEEGPEEGLDDAEIPFYAFQDGYEEEGVFRVQSVEEAQRGLFDAKLTRQYDDRFRTSGWTSPLPGLWTKSGASLQDEYGHDLVTDDPAEVAALLAGVDPPEEG